MVSVLGGVEMSTRKGSCDMEGTIIGAGEARAFPETVCLFRLLLHTFSARLCMSRNF